MRLLYDDGTGSFSLAQFYGDEIPPYAILSHTWGADEDEVTYQDVMKRRGLQKPGYKKLQFCARQAATHQLRYFWVDTCCINKWSDQELSESINSMFRWYQQAVRCYIYLSDFMGTDWQGLLRSRWFTRGWTLQELLAAKQADFYDSNGLWYGSKTALGGWINQATGIPEEAITGQPLDTFSVEDRLSWAQHRHTKREEDSAYSLLGIFDVSMPLVYGEGRDKAYYRLLKEIESGGHTRELNQKYSKFLPSAVSTEQRNGVVEAVISSPQVRAVPSLSATSASTSLPVKPVDAASDPVWDSHLSTWTVLRRSSKFQLYFRSHWDHGMRTVGKLGK
jgi:hypothetical protein